MKKHLNLLLIIVSIILINTQGYSKTSNKRVFKTLSVLTSDSLAGRMAGSGYDLKTAKYIERELLKAGCKPFYGESGITEFKFARGKDSILSYNVVMVMGERQNSPYFLIGAHHDHLGIRTIKDKDTDSMRTVIYRGANDNASGVAATIEIAHNLKKHSRKMKHPIIFAAFGAEEMGLHGARALAKQIEQDSIKLSFMVNLEMLGTLDEQKNVEILGADTFDMENSLKEIDNPQKINFIPQPAKLHRSDHIPFIGKCPIAVFATTGAKHYHSPFDDMCTIKLKEMGWIVDYILEFVRERNNL